MELVPEDTSTDWERLRMAFEAMRRDLSLYIPEEPRRDDESDDDITAFGKEIERRRKVGGVSMYEKSVQYAKQSGELILVVTLTPHFSLGHKMISALFNANTSFALRDAEVRALYRRVVHALRGHRHRFDARWTESLLDPITVHGKWA